MTPKYVLKLGGILTPERIFLSDMPAVYHELSNLHEQLLVARGELIRLKNCGESWVEQDAKDALIDMNVIDNRRFGMSGMVNP